MNENNSNNNELSDKSALLRLGIKTRAFGFLCDETILAKQIVAEYGGDVETIHRELIFLDTYDAELAHMFENELQLRIG